VFAFQWQVCSAGGDSCVDVRGADEPRFVPTAADVRDGETVRVRIVAIGRLGDSSVYSAATAPISGQPPASLSDPTISGQAQDGMLLTAGVGDWSSSEPYTLSVYMAGVSSRQRLCRRPRRARSAVSSE
jgi:hypothetical protein